MTLKKSQAKNANTVTVTTSVYKENKFLLSTSYTTIYTDFYYLLFVGPVTTYTWAGLKTRTLTITT